MITIRACRALGVNRPTHLNVQVTNISQSGLGLVLEGEIPSHARDMLRTSQSIKTSIFARGRWIEIPSRLVWTRDTDAQEGCTRIGVQAQWALADQGTRSAFGAWIFDTALASHLPR